MNEADYIQIAKMRAVGAFEAPDRDLPLWKQAILKNRMDAAEKKIKVTDTIRRQSVANGAMLRPAVLDERRLMTFAPTPTMVRFRRLQQAASCSPIVLELLAELLGMRHFGVLSEVCTAWYDGVRDREDVWALLSTRVDGGLGLGTGSSQGQLDLPTYAVMLPGANICVCDSGNSRLQSFSPQGRVKNVFPIGRGTRNGGHLSMPCSLTCDAAAKMLYVVVSDGRGSLVCKYRIGVGIGGTGVSYERIDPSKRRRGGGRGLPSAEPAFGWECPSCTNLHAVGEADSPTAVCMRCGAARPKTPTMEAMAVEAPEGSVILRETLYVTCARWHRVVAFDTSSLQPVRTFGSAGRGLGQLRCPQGICALDADGQEELYVADMHNDRIAIFAPQGACLGEIGFRGTGPGQFIYPRGVAIVRSELLVVAERQRVQVLTLIGEPRQVLRVPGASRLAGVCVCLRQVSWTGRQPQSQAFLYCTDLDAGRVHELEVHGRVHVAWESPTHLHTRLGTIRLGTGSRHAQGDSDADADDADATAAHAEDGRSGAADERAAARAARVAQGRKAYLQQGRADIDAGRAPKLRQRTRLLTRVSRHPKGDVGTRLLEMLELPPNATDAAVDHAIRLVMRLLHPDYSINLDAKGSRLGKELIAAFQKVSDVRDQLQTDREQKRAETEHEWDSEDSD